MVDVPVALVVQVPLVSGSHLYVIWCSAVEYRIMEFRGDPRNVPYSALLVRQWIRARRQSTRLSGRISHVLYVKVGFRSIPREWLDDLKRALSPHFAAFFVLRPHGRECPFFQPSMTKSSSLSRARGGGDAGSLTRRCSATPIRCNRAVVWRNTSL